MEITFGKDRYHLNGAMETWCADHIGKGGWTYGSPVTWEGMKSDWVWVIYSMFGNTTFAFKEQKDYNWFVLRWA